MTFTPARPLPLWGVTQVRFGYPNEEAFRENPRLSPGFDGIGFYEVLNSSWSGEVRDFNRENFPETPEDLGLRHFVWAFKENTLEVLSSGFEAERLPSESHRAVLEIPDTAPEHNPYGKVVPALLLTAAGRKTGQAAQPTAGLQEGRLGCQWPESWRGWFERFAFGVAKCPPTMSRAS